MCGLPIPFLVFLLTAVIVGAVVLKLRGWFKKGLPLLEKLRDEGHDFILFVIICLAMVFGAVGVASTIREHNSVITAAFASIRGSCE